MSEYTDDLKDKAKAWLEVAERHEVARKRSQECDRVVDELSRELDACAEKLGGVGPNIPRRIFQFGAKAVVVQWRRIDGGRESINVTIEELL